MMLPTGLVVCGHPAADVLSISPRTLEVVEDVMSDGPAGRKQRKPALPSHAAPRLAPAAQPAVVNQGKQRGAGSGAVIITGLLSMPLL